MNRMNRSVSTALAVIIMSAVGISANAADWETDFEKASADASKSGKYMLLDFSGSDWCGWCIKLDKEVFNTAEFKEFAEKNLVCVMIDFPNKKKQDDVLKAQNTALAKKYDVQGYPTVIVLTPDGAVVERTGYRKGGAGEYVKFLQTMIDDHKQKQAGKATEKPAPAEKAIPVAEK